jgi:hypothetical protein
MEAYLEKLRAEAAECKRISDFATDKEKRQLFARIADHLNVLAGDVAKAIDSKKTETDHKGGPQSRASSREQICVGCASFRDKPKS